MQNTYNFLALKWLFVFRKRSDKLKVLTIIWLILVDLSWQNSTPWCSINLHYISLGDFKQCGLWRGRGRTKIFEIFASSGFPFPWLRTSDSEIRFRNWVNFSRMSKGLIGWLDAELSEWPRFGFTPQGSVDILPREDFEPHGSFSSRGSADHHHRDELGNNNFSSSIRHHQGSCLIYMINLIFFMMTLTINLLQQETPTLVPILVGERPGWLPPTLLLVRGQVTSITTSTIITLIITTSTITKVIITTSNTINIEQRSCHPGTRTSAAACPPPQPPRPSSTRPPPSWPRYPPQYSRWVGQGRRRKR